MKPAPRRARPQPERVLGLLGLGQRARALAVGVEPVRAGLRADRIHCLVVAGDASPRTHDKVVRLANARRVPLIPGPPAEAIGARLGRPAVQVVGVLDRALAEGILGAAETALTED
jgi:ribosomal protein L7Ae-like RNA K-turn-binding protein